MDVSNVSYKSYITAACRAAFTRGLIGEGGVFPSASGYVNTREHNIHMLTKETRANGRRDLLGDSLSAPVAMTSHNKNTARRASNSNK